MASSRSTTGASTRVVPPKPPGARWTDEQWAGVSTTGGSLLVSAAAGSGKTAVLAERCAYLVCDAQPPCDVDELLVVTFTEAAAAEMKSRIERALRARIESAPSPRLTRQLALIDRAQVSTLHGFCAKLIRQHFHLLDLDPAFTVLDGDEAALLRTEIARQLFEERYEAPDSAAFRALVDAYADGNDERLVRKLIQTHDLLNSLRDPREWTTAARRRLEEVTAGDFRQSAMGATLEREIARGLASLRRTCDRSITIIAGMAGLAPYLDCLHACRQTLADWADALEAHGIDALSAKVCDLKLPRLKSISNDTPGKSVATALINAVREPMKKGELRRMLSFSTTQWRDGIARVLPHAQVFLALVDDFAQRYAREKAALRGVDFSDLETLALRALRDPVAGRLAPSGVARLLHRQFAHVLVDEYQDINEVQDAILHLASRECLWSKAEGGGMKDEARRSSSFIPHPSSLLLPNLFCVGDVKQSIYRFRLAEPARFLERQSLFRTDGAAGTVIPLQHNFRSRGPLLGAINAVFERLMTHAAADIEYDRTHRLQEGVPYPAADEPACCFTGAPIELHVLPAELDGDADDEDPAGDAACDPDPGNGADGASDDDDAEPDRAEREAMLVARKIDELVRGRPEIGQSPMRVFDKEAQAYRPIRFSDIVILLRAMKRKGDDYADVLRRSLIPVHSESGTGYFASMEVNDVLSLLQVLNNRAQDIPLAAVLRSPIASLPEPEDALARIRLAYPERSIPFHQAVVRYASEQQDELSAKLKDVLNQLDHWRTLAQRRPLAELIWDIYDSTGYLAFCAGLRDGEQRKANLIDLHDRARQFGSFQRQGLARFLAFLDQLRDESDLGQPPVVSEGENVVRIMTIHHSKGLEFPVVFLPDLGKKINLQDCSGSILVDRHAYLGMDVVDDQRQVRYPSLASTLVAKRVRQQSMAEELRVLYVAMTRAKEHLILIGTGKADLAASWTESWAGHDGPLPADTVLGATSMLDWLGPVAAATAQPGGPGPIQMIPYTAAEVGGWPSPESLRPSEGKRQERLARLAPLDPPPPHDPRAQEIIDRLTSGYRYAPFTHLAAVEAATAISKKGKSARVGESAATSRVIDFAKPLELPRAVRTELKPSAADIGEATHLVLQYLDFAQPCDIANLEKQIADLVARRLVAPAAAKAVDLESICWLTGSAAGRLIREHIATLRRELPIYLALPPDELDPSAASDDPLDRVMLRSRLDLMLRTPRGWEIIDYKTDRVGDATLAARVEIYRGQMALYRRAVEAITGQPPAAVHLVFLHARQVVTV